jgi:hypothetical protein
VVSVLVMKSQEEQAMQFCHAHLLDHGLSLEAHMPLHMRVNVDVAVPVLCVSL